VIDQAWKEDSNMNVDDFWREYLLSLASGDRVGLEQPQAWHFCDNQADADELVELVLAGKKVATATLEWDFKNDREPLPMPGDLSIIQNWAGEPKAIIRTTRVDVMPFYQVGGKHAYLEGEGDQSLEYWRKAHEKVFTRRCRELDRRFSKDAMVVCERFEMIWP
jgi:uncharacterized protein YhfF